MLTVNSSQFCGETTFNEHKFKEESYSKLLLMDLVGFVKSKIIL